MKQPSRLNVDVMATLKKQKEKPKLFALRTFSLSMNVRRADDN